MSDTLPTSGGPAANNRTNGKSKKHWLKVKKSLRVSLLHLPPNKYAIYTSDTRLQTEQHKKEVMSLCFNCSVNIVT